MRRRTPASDRLGCNRRPNPDRIRPQSLLAVSPPVPDDAARLGQSRAAHGGHLRPSSRASAACSKRRASKSWPDRRTEYRPPCGGCTTSRMIVAGWPPETPVAYWDAGDVLFQGQLGPLWDLVRADPDRLLVAREPVGIGESPVIVPWTDHIIDPVVRREMRELLAADAVHQRRLRRRHCPRLDGLPARRRPSAEDGPQGRLALGRPGRDGPLPSPSIRQPGAKSPTAGTTASSFETRRPTEFNPAAASRAWMAPRCTSYTETAARWSRG